MPALLAEQDVRARLKPGDILLYSTPGLVGWAIRTKTYSDVSHAETYIGIGMSAASRGPGRDKMTGKTGVDTYPFRFDGLEYVLRPKGQFDFPAALRWHHTVCGQGYDFLGLLTGFYTAGGHGLDGKMFCSEHTARFAKRAGIELFPDDYDCDKVAPGDLKKSVALRLVIRRIREGKESNLYGG